jgi:signal peptidase I
MSKRYWFFTTVITFLLVISIKNLIFVDYRVEGGSMQPTLEEGHQLSINKVNQFLFEIKRFDIVVFKGPGDKDAFIKRVIGLPGDELQYKNDQLFINGVAIEEPYLNTLKNGIPFGRLTADFTLKETTGMKTIPQDSLFVIGDNRRVSHDSRHFGLIHKDDVIGKVRE